MNKKKASSGQVAVAVGKNMRAKPNNRTWCRAAELSNFIFLYILIFRLSGNVAHTTEQQPTTKKKSFLSSSPSSY